MSPSSQGYVIDMTRKIEDEMAQTTMRLPRDLYQRLKRVGGDRGMGEEIRRRLEESFEPESTNPKTKERSHPPTTPLAFSFMATIPSKSVECSSATSPERDVQAHAMRNVDDVASVRKEEKSRTSVSFPERRQQR
jgi:hypothetical protein